MLSRAPNDSSSIQQAVPNSNNSFPEPAGSGKEEVLPEGPPGTQGKKTAQVGKPEPDCPALCGNWLHRTPELRHLLNSVPEQDEPQRSLGVTVAKDADPLNPRARA